MPRPAALEPQFDNIPEELRNLPQWIVWKHHFHKARQAWIKLPISPHNGQAASTTKPGTWASFGAAATAYEFVGGYDGIGFVFVAGGGLVGIDMDNCLRDGPSDLAREILDAVPGYVERSPSGNGIHIITRADIGRAYKNDSLGLEIYTSGRYFTITGAPL